MSPHSGVCTAKGGAQSTPILIARTVQYRRDVSAGPRRLRATTLRSPCYCLREPDVAASPVSHIVQAIVEGAVRYGETAVSVDAVLRVIANVYPAGLPLSEKEIRRELAQLASERGLRIVERPRPAQVAH